MGFYVNEQSLTFPAYALLQKILTSETSLQRITATNLQVLCTLLSKRIRKRTGVGWSDIHEQQYHEL